MRYISIDPGGTTGVAIYDNEGWTRIHLGPDQHHRALWNCLENWAPDVVICEDFVYQERPLQRKAYGGIPKVELISRDYIGVVKLFCQKYDTELHMHPVPFKEFFLGHERLQKLGLYDPAFAPHGMDATSHLLYHLAFCSSQREWFERLR